MISKPSTVVPSSTNFKNFIQKSSKKLWKRLVRQLIHDQPVLLLDDVLSELDRNRQNYLLDSIQDTQTIITCTGLEEFIDGKLTLDRVFRVVNGTISIESQK